MYRSLLKLGKLNFASDFSLNEVEANDCGLEIFFEKVIHKSKTSKEYNFGSILVHVDRGKVGTPGYN